MNPILLVGAALVGLPILLHLIMKQEPKRLPFPAFRFLKQKLKTNQRKMRLRHFVLLALRMLLIALFCLTLYQPAVKSDRLDIRGEQPVATVIVIDTTPSMGYRANDRTRLDEAKRRARELLDELPERSPVAIVDTADLAGTWLQGDLSAARRYLDDLKETRAGQPVSAALAVAYQLLVRVEQETETPELPKLIAVFTDRTAASWDPARTDDLKRLRDAVPDPKPAHVVFDFGIDKPANVAILAAEMKPQVVPAEKPAGVAVTVGAVGNDRPVEVTVQAKLDGSDKAETKVAVVGPGQTRAVAFEFRDLKPGLHQARFVLGASDKLEFDNTRYLTFKVGASRRILTVTDDPPGAWYWQRAHMARGEFACLVVTPGDIEFQSPGGERGGETGGEKVAMVRYAPDADKPAVTVSEPLGSFEAVCLLNVRDPSAVSDQHKADGSLWDRLRPYARGGGKLLVVPGSDANTRLEGYNASADDLMPGKLGAVVWTRKASPPPPPQKAVGWPAPRDGKYGVTWDLDGPALKHPLIKNITDEERQVGPRLDLTATPRTVQRFWAVEPYPGAATVVYYRDSADPAARHPAVLERPVLDPKDGNRPKGKAVLLTTRLDKYAAEEVGAGDEWNDYWNLESSWCVYFPWLLVRYLAGDSADANFNYPTGATVSLPLPRGRMTRDTQLNLDGPVADEDARPRPGDKQTELRFGPPRTNAAGNFTLSLVGKDGAVLWRDGFSTNVPAEESNLERVPVEAIEEVVGKDRVVPVDRTVSVGELITGRFGGVIDLFPWLMLAVLALFVGEGLIANRFYRKPKA